ncbi:hypothetical protein GQ472_01625 [archaeon]|nr:hypothetical protein [archaeon]
MATRFMTKGKGNGRKVIPLKDRASVGVNRHAVKIHPNNISKNIFIFGGKDKDGKEIIYHLKDMFSPDAVDIADSYHKDITGMDRNFGWDSSASATKESISSYFPDGVRFVSIPKDYKAKPHKRDILDDIIVYESGEMTPAEELAFFKKNKDILSKLQGHYGRRISRM